MAPARNAGNESNLSAIAGSVRPAIFHGRRIEMADAAESQKATEATGGQRRFKIRLKLTDRESGESRICTLDEAKTWDWRDPETWRMVNGWHVTSFQGLLNILYLKMEKGIEEVEILEAPRFTMLAGG
jgi:hypothetical protein